MDPVPAYVWERHFPARNVRRTFSPLVKGERQSYVRCLLKQGNVSTAQTLPTSRALWIVQRCGHLQHQNAHFGDCSHRTSKQAFTSARTTLPISSTLVAVATVPPDQKASFCQCHQRVQVCRATHRYWSGAGLPISFWQLAPPPRLGRITELTPHSTTPQVKSVQTSQTPDIAFLCF